MLRQVAIRASAAARSGAGAAAAAQRRHMAEAAVAADKLHFNFLLPGGAIQKDAAVVRSTARVALPAVLLPGGSCERFGALVACCLEGPRAEGWGAGVGGVRHAATRCHVLGSRLHGAAGQLAEHGQQVAVIAADGVVAAFAVCLLLWGAGPLQLCVGERLLSGMIPLCVCSDV